MIFSENRLTFRIMLQGRDTFMALMRRQSRSMFDAAAVREEPIGRDAKPHAERCWVRGSSARGLCHSDRTSGWLCRLGGGKKPRHHGGMTLPVHMDMRSPCRRPRSDPRSERKT